jgi:hypothetical protein
MNCGCFLRRELHEFKYAGKIPNLEQRQTHGRNNYGSAT